MQLIVNISAEQFLARLRGTGDRLAQNMQRVVTRLSIEVQAAVKDKLTGGVLHVRTGTLRRSINRVVVTTPDGGALATVGTNVVYAGVHEFGFHGPVNVRAFVRKAPKTGAPVNVRAHAMQMNMPERSFLRSTLTDFTPRIRSELRAAALEAVL